MSGTYDVVIVGGGPAGLSAGLVLGRCCRRVVVLDAGQPRNAASRAVHNFLGNEGIAPAELRRRGRAELLRAGGELRDEAAVDAARLPDGFAVRTATGDTLRARRVLLATGVRDNCPEEIEGIRTFEGCGVYYCSYCDAFNVRGRPLVALGHGLRGADLALALTTWSRDVVLCTNGSGRPGPEIEARLAGYGVALRTEPIARLAGDGHLRALVPRRGAPIPCEGLFVQEGDRPQSDLPQRLGCALTASGGVRTFEGQRSSVPGVFVAGDIATPHRAVVLAAASGAEAAFAINRDLREEERAVVG